MNARKRQAVRLLSLAVATGTLVASATGSAGAAVGEGKLKHALTGTAQTDVVQVSLNLPAATPLVSQLPAIGPVDLGKPITLNLIHTDGKLVRDQIKGVVDQASSTSTLGAGSLFEKGGLLAPINRTVTATLAAPGTHRPADPALSFDQGPLKLAVPTLEASAVRSLLKTAGKGEIASLRLGNLADLLPAGLLDTLNEQLAAIIGTTDSTDGSAVGTVTGTVNKLLGAIDKQLEATPVGGVVHTALTTLQKQIKELQEALPKLVAALQEGSVVDLKALDSAHKIGTTAKNAVSSTAGVALAHLSLLGGFVTLDGFNNNATVSANGKANGAKAVLNPNLAKVHIGSPVGLDLVLGPNGLAANLLGSALPAAIVNLVNQLVESVENVLAVAGVKIAAAEYKTRYNKDRSAVSVAGSGLQVLVNSPLNRNNSKFEKALVGVKVGAISASAGNFVAAGNTPGTKVPVVDTPKADLPHTGAELPIIAGAALMFLGGAYIIRRKMTADVEI